MEERTDQMRCPQCFAFGVEETTERQFRFGQGFVMVPVGFQPKPDCPYCKGEGFVLVTVEVRDLIEVEQGSLL